MIAHIVFDLPVEGPFDYLVPQELQARVSAGWRVKVAFGPKSTTGFVVSTAQTSHAGKELKSIKSLAGDDPIFDGRDLVFARRFAAYYGCTLGEALMVMTRHRNQPPPSSKPARRSTACLYHCPGGSYAPVIERLTDDRNDYFILVPEAFTAQGLTLSAVARSRTGLRSSMFEAFTRAGLIIMVDEEDALYKQEQTPMYETRQVVLMAQEVYGFDLAFIGATPSVEVMQLAQNKTIGYELTPAGGLPRPVVIDATNYKFLEKGILSPPLRNSLQDNVNNGRQTLVLLNRRGSYRATRCKNCGHVLKCDRCASSMVYSRAHKQFICRHCTYHLSTTPQCPACGKLEWKSYGIGVEQMQKELGGLFPTARIASFDKDTKFLPADFDILIATQAVLHFKHKLNVQTVMLPDIDAELNRLDMRSSFRGWALAQRIRVLGKQFFVQTRNLHHHTLQALSADNTAKFYDEEMKLRRELGFPPFYHWVSVTARSRDEKSSESMIQEVYNQFLGNKPQEIALTAVEPDIPSKLRGQYRFRVMAGGGEVEAVVNFIKENLSAIKRRSKVIITLNVDP